MVEYKYVRYTLWSGSIGGGLCTEKTQDRNEVDLTPIVEDIRSGRVRVVSSNVIVDMMLDPGVDWLHIYVNGVKVASLTNPWSWGAQAKRFYRVVPINIDVILTQPKVETKLFLSKPCWISSAYATGSVILELYLETPKSYTPPTKSTPTREALRYITKALYIVTGVGIAAIIIGAIVGRRR